MRPRLGVLAMVALFVLTGPPAGAVHFFRNTTFDCTPATGDLTDDTSPTGPIAATVLMLHNSFNDEATGGPVTFIEAGQAVTWTWNSAHCHSVGLPDNSESFTSGFHFPTVAPNSLQAVPGFFEYPIPTGNPQLTYTHTFANAGTFLYSCVHHAIIGMVGVVVVS